MKRGLITLGCAALLLSSASCSSCNSGTRNLPLSVGGEPACLTADGYVLAEREIDPMISMRVLSDHETAFVGAEVRRRYLFVQLSHTWTAPALAYSVTASVERNGQALQQVDPSIETLAAITGEKPHSDAQEAARDLIIWATGGVALFSKEVTKVPTHVQLLALLESQPCAAETEGGCENLQLMLERPQDERGVYAVVLHFDFLVEDSEGIRERGCPSDGMLRLPLPAGDDLPSRVQALFVDGPTRVTEHRGGPPQSR